MFTDLSRNERSYVARDRGLAAPRSQQLFRNFLLETLSVDELSFFLEARNSLLGFRTSARVIVSRRREDLRLRTILILGQNTQRLIQGNLTAMMHILQDCVLGGGADV